MGAAGLSRRRSAADHQVFPRPPEPRLSHKLQSIMEEIAGIKHPAFRDALALTRPSGRTAAGQYLVEGADLVTQALRSLSPVMAVFATTSEAAALQDACAARGAPLYALGS